MSETVLTAWWESKLAQRLNAVASIVMLVLLWRLALDEDLSWVSWVVAGAAVVLLALTRWPYGALLLVIGTSAMPVFFVEVFGWNARPEHFAAAIVFVLVSVWLFIRRRKMRLETLDYCILTYVVINYVSSAFTSVSPSDTVRWALLHNLAVLPYFLIRVLVQDLTVLGKAFRILLWVGIIESAYGIVCYVSHHIFGTLAGMEIGQYLGEVAAPYGSMYEPNLFGAYTACCAVLFLAVYMLEGRRFVHLLGFLVASLATSLSFSRAALLAFVLAISWVLWRALPLNERRMRKKGASFILGLGLLLIVAAATVGGVLQERFSNLFEQGLAEETTITRLIVMEEALQDIPKHPLFGSGTASFNLTFDWAKYVPEWGGSKTWIGNAPLRILHDTGIFGLTALVTFFVLIWWKTWRGLREPNNQVAILLALSAGTLVYCISFESSDGSNLAFSWVQLGLLASTASLISKRSQGFEGVDGASPASDAESHRG